MSSIFAFVLTLSLSFCRICSQANGKAASVGASACVGVRFFVEPYRTFENSLEQVWAEFSNLELENRENGRPVRAFA